MGVINEDGYDVSDRTQRRDRIQKIKRLKQVYDEILATGGANLQEKRASMETLQELEALERVDACESDIIRFAYEYFSDDLNPENEGNLIPEGSNMKNAPDFHCDLCGILDEVSNTQVNKRVGYAAPRGHAKSAYLSNIFPVHQIVYDLRNYILIISETDGASKKFLEWIAMQLKFNVKLREDFGSILEPQKQANGKDNQESFLSKTGILVESSSIGKQLRGKRNGAHRPDLVILDDLESSKNTNTPELRTKNLDWFNKVVIPIGDPDKTAFVYMGTIVHMEGLLPHVLKRADFESRVYAAIIANPEREDLWEQFEEILRDQEVQDRKVVAHEFYEVNSIEMDKGVHVLWGKRWSYEALIMEKVTMGTRAFNSEYMNNPIDPESQIFNPELFQFYDYDRIAEVRHNLEYFGAWDIAMGKNNRSDYNAIVIIGRDKKSGILYVVESWAKKVPAHKALQEAADKIIKYRPKIFAVETVAAQYDLYRQLRELLLKRKHFLTKLQPVTSRSNKEARIETMEPLFENGAIRFMKHQRLLLEQLEQFPSGKHDDLPDCLQMVVDVCSRSTKRSYHRKPKGL